MSNGKAQNFKNHSRIDPGFHLLVLPVLITTLVLSIVKLIHNEGFEAAWYVVLSMVFIVLAFKVRLYAIKVQDRVIRLEERLRLQTLAPELHADIARLSVDQLIGLRFASDGEVIDLAKAALAENLTRSQIKGRVKTWVADNLRV